MQNDYPQDDQREFVANCAVGMEMLVCDEVRSFGGKEIEQNPGVVWWKGSLETGYLGCLWSRYSSKILLKLDSFKIENDTDLYNRIKDFSWQDHLNNSLTFSVSCSVTRDSVIDHSHFAALRVKDGLVDSFREKGLNRPNVVKNKPDIRIHLFIDKFSATLYLDMSGESLHRRGYRSSTGIAPLKETLGAAIVKLAGWGEDIHPDQTLIDPMCGSGTLLIEAALLFGDSAPGLTRRYFGFSKWLGHKSDLWKNLVNEAIAREEVGLDKKWPKITGYDCDKKVVRVARENVKRAGLEDYIDIQVKEVGHLQEHSGKGFIISNLPFGERLSEKEEVYYLYRGLGKIMKKNFQGWNISLFISQPDLVDRLNLKVTSSYPLKNGPIFCKLFNGVVDSTGDQLFEWRLRSIEGDGDDTQQSDFANRLRKNFQKMNKWASKNNAHCYRLYDRDLPEYNVAIDIYEKYLLIQEYKAPSSVDEGKAKERFQHILQTIKSVFEIGRDRIFIKERKRQRGKDQYSAKQGKKRFVEVAEGECFFLVNFKNYLDTGLFLDHRPIRLEFKEIAFRKKFLNLFGYTGTASVHAAKGGALQTTTVDLSSTYLEWARWNMSLNGFSDINNIVVKQDCMSWLKEHREKFDIIFIDPPTFSNTKKKDRVFNVQKDHKELIFLASNLLEEGGVIYFSTNYKGFKIDEELKSAFDVRNISKKSVPFDFQRKKSIHHCYLVQKKQENKNQ